MAWAAVLVCRVASTKCPVRAASVAILAVSKSRISPTRMTSGSCQHAEDRCFAVGGWDAGETEIGLARTDRHRKTPVLGKPAFRDIEITHDLQPGKNRTVQLAGKMEHLAHVAIDAKTNARIDL